MRGIIHTTAGFGFDFMGAMNPAILYMRMQAMLYTACKYLGTKGDLRLFVLVWFAVTYVPYFPLVMLLHRVTYIFCFLDTIPAVCAAIAYMLMDRKVPFPVLLGYIAAVMVSFGYMFPFKGIPV